jgi:acetyl-CoA C-acetyltransferase
MTDWTRLPVLVGAGQITNREQDPAAAPDPFDLMVIAATEAAGQAAGTGTTAEKVLRDLTHLYMVYSMSVRHGDPAGLLAERLGATGAETRTAGMGGNIPQWLVDRAADLVAGGGRPRVLIAGSEALATRKRAKKAGIHLEWPSAEGWPDTWPPLEPDLGVHKVERRHGLEQATTMYALLESAVRHAAGHGIEEHRRAMGELMAGLNAVAVANPHSWFPERRSAEEIMAVTADNRLIFDPYPKYVNAVMDVDMGAAVILTDAQTARDWGLGPDEVAYVTGWADAKDIWFLSERPALERTGALEACARQATTMAGIGVEDIGAFDLYSCFPSSIEVARDSIGVPAGDARPLTLTGGLPYHGGPGSNYVTHAIANALDYLRRGDGEHALVHGNGYYLTKHAVGIYSRRPPATEPRPRDIQPELDAAARPCPVERTLQGPATVLAYTVPYDREGVAGEGQLIVEAGGVRSAALADGELTAALLQGDAVGSAVTVAPGAEKAPNRARVA